MAVDEVAASMGADGDEMPGVIDIASLQRRLIARGAFLGAIPDIA